MSVLGRLSANCWEDEHNPAMNTRGGKILNSGTITVEARHEDLENGENNYYPNLSLGGTGGDGGRGLLENRGTLTNKCDLNVNGGELDFQSGTVTNEADAYFGIRTGGTLAVAEELQISNHGSIEAMDTFDGAGALMQPTVTVPSHEFWKNDTETDEGGNTYETSRYTHGAEVWHGDDIDAALEAGDTFLRAQGDVEWENGTLLQGVKLQLDNYWDDEEQSEKVTTLTLSGTVHVHGELVVGWGSGAGRCKLIVDSGATVTVSKGNDAEGPDAHMQNDGIVENKGTITVTGEGAHLGGDDGEFSGTAVDNETEDDNVVSDGWRADQEPNPEP